MPLDFGQLLTGHNSHHIETLGLKGTKNGALLALARSHYEVLLTLDRGILHQHNHANQSLVVIVVRVKDSKPETVNNRASDVLAAISSAKAGDLIELALPI